MRLRACFHFFVWFWTAGKISPLNRPCYSRASGDVVPPQASQAAAAAIIKQDLSGCWRSQQPCPTDMGSSDYLGEDDNKNDVLQIQMHPDRVGADPTEGWRRGARGALRKSCDTCTSSKTKCQGSIPCDRCKKRRIDCKFRSVESVRHRLAARERLACFHVLLLSHVGLIRANYFGSWLCLGDFSAFFTYV